MNELVTPPCDIREICTRCGRRRCYGRNHYRDGLCPGCRQADQQARNKAAREAAALTVDVCRNAPCTGPPTTALPGSTEKLAVLEQRAARLETLWHPGDATDQDEPMRGVVERFIGALLDEVYQSAADRIAADRAAE